MENKKIKFDRISFQIDCDGDLEVVIEAFDGDVFAYLEPEELTKLKDFLIQL